MTKMKVREVVQHGGLIDGDDVCYSISRVDDYTRGQALCIKRQHSLNGNIHPFETIAFKHNLDHSLPVDERIHRRLCQKHFSSPCIHAKLLKTLVPQMNHVFPVSNYSVVDGIRNLKERAHRLGLIAYHDILYFEIVHA